MTVSSEVRAYLRELGASDAEIDEASAIRSLPGLASDLVLRRGATRTASDVAAELGLTVPFVVEVFRQFGIAVDADAAVLSDADAVLLQMVVDPEHTAVMTAGADDTLLVVAQSLARIADAVVSMYVQDVESQLNAVDPNAVGSIAWVRQNAEAAELALALGSGLGVLFRHHLQSSIARQRASQEGITERALARLAVGFVDLVGFTPLSRSLSTHDLVALVRRFEKVAFDVATNHGGRIVKHIGDEIMFTALTADAGARIALELVGAFGGDVQPRGGMTFGEVLALHGDCYGPLVNLASRLTDGAVPGEVLVDAPTSAALVEVATEPAGRRMLKGFDEPVAVFSLVG